MELSVKSAKGGKIKICADGEELFTVPCDIWYSSHLREGDEVTWEELSVLKSSGDSSLALESAFRMLNLRDHSEYELRSKLSRNFPDEAVDSAVFKLKELGLINDAEFAIMFAEELYERKAFAPKRILLELKNRGIRGEIAENAINALDIDSKIGIIKVIEKYRLTSESTAKEKDRAIRKLLNMGYSFSDISKYINIHE